jgi:hypothetical protein
VDAEQQRADASLALALACNPAADDELLAPDVLIFTQPRARSPG